eukprot:TRINITY_DN226_c0_g1_i4.p1 TRINITY_DN226_c0_g1~~TRINITY_DN226_c0_g1_i4.p1  ORF type:complete len:348 (+),score=51.97 TRINITY_DN226_c0_g1_i4:65-1108(+)
MKRASSESLVASPLKKPRTELVVANSQNSIQIRADPYQRTSSLSNPTLKLSGHGAPVYGCEFDPSGDNLATCSFDKTILLWKVHGECENYGMLTGHKNAVTDIHWTVDGENLVSCSADKTVSLWDIKTGMRIRKFEGHKSFVNACSPSRHGELMVASVSDDSTAKLWDHRTRGAVKSLKEKYQLTAVAFNEDGDQVICGGIDNTIRVWDIRKDEISLELSGHMDTVTGLSLSPCGNFVLSNSMDQTLRCWDIRPFCPSSRCTTIFEGHTHGVEKNLLRCCWSPDGRMVTAGSSDGHLCVWDRYSGSIKYRFSGHSASLNDISWHPDEPIICTCSTDKNIVLGELPHA